MKTKRMEDLYTLVWWTVWEIPFLTTSFMYLMSIQMHTEGGCEIFWYFRRRICWPNGCGSCSEFCSIDDALHQNSLFLQDHWCFFCLFGCFEASFERCKLSYLWTDPCFAGVICSYASSHVTKWTSQRQKTSLAQRSPNSRLPEIETFRSPRNNKNPTPRGETRLQEGCLLLNLSFLGRKFWVIRMEKLLNEKIVGTS